MPIDDSDQKQAASYPFAGEGLEAFTVQASRKERFIRTIINTHFTFYFGREMRYLEDERSLYRRLWTDTHQDHFTVRGLIKTLLTCREYLEGHPVDDADKTQRPEHASPLTASSKTTQPATKPPRLALETLHQ
jgi:hypothetical protein